ncbi:hypothetical protein GOL75_10695 [Sinorhizobium medicae]|nr:hypothetical protein [Sinorhizobium medicae]MDX1161800.1 hypothetical protein [Sinorhizobium medicae]
MRKAHQKARPFSVSACSISADGAVFAPRVVAICAINRLVTILTWLRCLAFTRLPPCVDRLQNWYTSRQRRVNRGRPAAYPGHRLLHVSFDRIRLKDKNMQQIKVLQRALCV